MTAAPLPAPPVPATRADGRPAAPAPAARLLDAAAAVLAHVEGIASGVARDRVAAALAAGVRAVEVVDA